MTNAQIWRIIAKHYGGSINPPSLLAQKMFMAAREVATETEFENYDRERETVLRAEAEIFDLRNQIHALKGEPPDKPIPMAAHGPIYELVLSATAVGYHDSDEGIAKVLAEADKMDKEKL